MHAIEQDLKEYIILNYQNLNNFCKVIDMPWTTLDAILKRGIKKARIDNIIKICKGLNIDCESLYYGSIVSLSKNKQNNIFILNSSIPDVECKNVQTIIKARRTQLGLTLKEVAKALGVSEGTVSRYETGDIRNMGIDKIQALSKVLQCSLGYLMGLDDDIPYVQSDFTVSSDEMELLTEYRKTDDETKHMIKRLLAYH